MNTKIKLHLGCGNRLLADFLNVDKLTPKIAAGAINFKQVDLTQFPWPFTDESVDFIYSHHLLEHLPNTVACMMEIWRILRPGGLMEAVVPYASSQLYLQDPTHVSAFTDVTVQSFALDHPYQHKYCAHGFEVILCELRDQVQDAPPPSICRALRGLIPRRMRMKLTYVLMGMFDEVHFSLKKPR
jgi:predicted SAM-dependent methyltransferase